MVSQRTSEVMTALLQELEDGSVAPRKVQDRLRARGYSVIEIQDAIQLALSQSLVQIDNEMLLGRSVQPVQF